MGKEDSMTDQASFADLEYQGKKRRTRREVFLERMESLVPWEKLEGRIRPRYFSSERGRRPYSLPVMLRVHIVQLCYNPRLRGGRLSVIRPWRTCCTKRSRCDALLD